MASTLQAMILVRRTKGSRSTLSKTVSQGAATGMPTLPPITVALSRTRLAARLVTGKRIATASLPMLHTMARDSFTTLTRR